MGFVNFQKYGTEAKLTWFPVMGVTKYVLHELQGG